MDLPTYHNGHNVNVNNDNDHHRRQTASFENNGIRNETVNGVEDGTPVSTGTVPYSLSRISGRSSGGDGGGGGGGELTLAFEGEVFVFPAITRDKVQAIILLLGKHETSTRVPTSDCLLQQHNTAVGNSSGGSNISHRIASLVRFREKRKERCFDKKIRYTCRKEVAQRMVRKNGQFISLKNHYKLANTNWDPNHGTPTSECTGFSNSPTSCQHCGTSEKSTPAMRRGPSGPRTLCNACGLMWANKGTLRDLTKGGRIVPYQSEPDTPSGVKPLAMEHGSSFGNHHEGSPEFKLSASESEKTFSRENDQDLLENDEAALNDSAVSLRNASVNFTEQNGLEDSMNGSGTEFEIPSGFDEPVGSFY